MKLDSVSVVVEYNKITLEDGSYYHDATFLPEHVFYGHGAASDAISATIKVEELNSMYKTPERYYGAVRIDYEDAEMEGLL